MCESIVVVGAALSADVDAPTERIHCTPATSTVMRCALPADHYLKVLGISRAVDFNV
jgi:hypothetical protein